LLVYFSFVCCCSFTSASYGGSSAARTAE
jgi:hypothetical protein